VSQVAAQLGGIALIYATERLGASAGNALLAIACGGAALAFATVGRERPRRATLEAPAEVDRLRTGAGVV